MPSRSSEQVALAGRDEADRVAGASRAAGAADPVHVGLGVGGDVVVHHVADALDVQAAGRDVRGHQDVELAGLQLVDDALALRLDDVAVDRGRGEAAGAERSASCSVAVLRAGEDEHRLEVLDLEDAGERVQLLRGRDTQVALRWSRDGVRLAFEVDLDRIVEVALRDLRICGGMVAENRATCLSAGVSARIVSTSSAKPIFSISSASSSTRNRSWTRSRVPLSRWSMTRPGVPTTTWTPRRRALQLDAVALAAVDGQHVHARRRARRTVERLADLQGEFAGRAQHERLRSLLAAGRASTGSAARTPRSCRCRSGRGRPRRDRRGACGMVAAWIAVGVSYPRSRPPSAPGDPARGRRNGAGPARFLARSPPDPRRQPPPDASAAGKGGVLTSGEERTARSTVDQSSANRRPASVLITMLPARWS